MINAKTNQQTMPGSGGIDPLTAGLNALGNLFGVIGKGQERKIAEVNRDVVYRDALSQEYMSLQDYYKLNSQAQNQFSNNLLLNEREKIRQNANPLPIIAGFMGLVLLILLVYFFKKKT